jgi:hypothetical protein
MYFISFFLSSHKENVFLKGHPRLQDKEIFQEVKLKNKAFKLSPFPIGLGLKVLSNGTGGGV